MNKEEIDKMFHRIELDRANDSCGFEFADGFSCTFDNIATCYDDRLKLYELVKQLQQENEKLKEENFNLREGIYIEKMSFSSEGRNFKELMEMATYEELKKENEKLNHYKLLYQKVKERNDKAIERLIIKQNSRNIIASVSDVIRILKGNNEESNDNN